MICFRAGKGRSKKTVPTKSRCKSALATGSRRPSCPPPHLFLECSDRVEKRSLSKPQAKRITTQPSQGSIKTIEKCLKERTYDRARPGRTRPGRQPEPAGRQHYGNEHADDGADGELGRDDNRNALRAICDRVATSPPVRRW